MITVRVEAKKSPKHGNGLFALDPIPKNTIVYYFNPEVDQSIDLAQATPAQIHFGYVCRLKPKTLTICGDLARWWNFSDSESETNTAESEAILNGEPVSVATKDIAVGEELLICQESDVLCSQKLGKAKS
jgi:SET domain-containing protein